MNKQSILGNISPIIPAGKDLDKAIAFYEQKLGFKTIHTEGKPVRMAIVKRDSAQIFLQKNDDKHLAEGTQFLIQVSHIEQLYAEFIAKDESIIHPQGHLETKPWGLKEFVVIDSFGVCITFYEVANS
ncbi:MAG: VOC family protein [Mojavia pulchra JT2-VF2]|jgi:catechol 2,3-dioxygenase-like lactoylglutathione lyase family enzyme|uniref:Bleomycin resistance protein n=1 Tax=Mojavia pulchra JT2-VF2 TaxID=287848 RepID=A0A951UGR4_9NOST|nr:VOC family protein [Mojavia pulchra JT2-VF2]